MGVRLRFRGGPLAGKVWEFDDDIDHIVVGRDPEQCQVVAPKEMTDIGRQHFGLKRSLGRYRLVLNRDNPVHVDGKQAMDGMELPAPADLRLGRKGPRITVLTLQGESVPETVRREKAGPGVRTRLEKTESSSRRNVKMIAGIGAVVVVLGVAGFLLFGEQEEKIDEFSATMASFLADADQRIDGELKRHEEELAEIKGSLGADRKELARLVGERQERAKVLAELRQRQDLSEAQRKKLEGRLQEKLADADKKLDKLNDKIGKAGSGGSSADWAAIASKFEAGIFLIVCDYSVAKLDPFTKKPRKDKKGNIQYKGRGTVIGTGFCIRGDGLLATNAHVVLPLEPSEAKKVHNRIAYQSGTGQGFEIRRYVRHPGWTPLPGGKTRPEPDIGFIQLKGIGGPTGAKVPVLSLADSAALRKLMIGSEIGTIGFPGELTRPYLDGKIGLISKRPMKAKRSHATFKNGFVGRLLSYDGTRRDFEHAHYIQHSAILTGGTSGSPLVDREGVVVGIHHAGLDSGGLEFGVRADEIRDYWNELKRTRKAEGW